MREFALVMLSYAIVLLIYALVVRYEERVHRRKMKAVLLALALRGFKGVK